MKGTQSDDALKPEARRRVSIDNKKSTSETLVDKEQPPPRRKSAKTDDTAQAITNKRSDKYWFEDGNLLLSCDDLTFLVHQSILSRLSVKFKDIIAKYRAEDSQVVRLKTPGSGKSWSMFLSLVYPSTGDEVERLTQAEWFSVYDVSRAYGFDGIRKVAFIEITSDVDKFIELIKLGRKHFAEMPEWCIQGFKGLCERDRPLTLEEGKELGIEDTIKIAEAREKLLCGAEWDEVAERFMW